MDEIYTRIQVYLMRKDKECGTLRFLTSKSTPSNAANVVDVCTAIKTILDDSTSLDNGRDSSVDEVSVNNFKFLLLNTNFRCQEYLCEDIVNGHLVDMCPSLSPYLFIEIIWALDYDEILSDSIFYIPIDLCAEILNVMRRCLDTDFQRAFNVVLKVVVNCYKKLILTNNQDTQVLDEQESLKQFLGSIQELLLLIPSLQTRNYESLSQLSKYERSGWVLMKILKTMKECVALRRGENISSVEDKEIEKSYRVNFGREFMLRLNPDDVTESVDQFSKEFIDILLENVKKIDCYVYMGWAEIDYAEDTSMSMQRAVGLACYNFIEYLGADQENEAFVHVVECLRQLSSRPDAPFSMSLEELCGEVDKGNKECLKKLIERFEEWNSSAVSCLNKNRSLVEKAESLTLINNGVKFFQISNQEELCTDVYSLVMKILLCQKLPDVVEIVVEFILTHDASRVLESANFEKDLKSYVNQGLALCSTGTSLRIILFFAIQNPRHVLKTLLKTCIGFPEYTNGVMLAEDFCKLLPILQIKDSNNISLLSNSLRTICSENIPWNSKKLVDLVRVLLNADSLFSDDLLNDVFIPVLHNDIVLSNVQSVLTCIRFAKDDLTPKFKKHELLCVLASQMTSVRKNTQISTYSRDEMLNSLIRTVQLFATEQMNSADDKGKYSLFADRLETDLEPLDKIYFAPQLGWISNDVSLNHVIQDYKKRCFYVLNQTKDVKYRCSDMEELLEAHGIEIGDFLQHLILRCTELEYLNFAKQALLVCWNNFGWKNEVDAYAEFSLATIKACNNLTSSSRSIDSSKLSVQKCSSLMKNLSKLTIWFISIDVMTDYESVYKSLVSALSALNPTDDLKNFRMIVNRSTVTVYSYETVAELVAKVDEFTEKYKKFGDSDAESLSAERLHFNSRFISMCLNWPMGKNSLLLSKIDKKLYFKCQSGL